jgi:hypothetical protein
MIFEQLRHLTLADLQDSKPIKEEIMTLELVTMQLFELTLRK